MNRKSPFSIRRFLTSSGGQGIRTLDGCNPIAVFKPAAIFGGAALQGPYYYAGFGNRVRTSWPRIAIEELERAPAEHTR
jgi:hypothetical protein